MVSDNTADSQSRLVVGESELAFHIAEFNSLRSELNDKSRQISEMMRFMMLSTAASVVWLISVQNSLPTPISMIAAWLPFLLVFFFNAQRRDLIDGIKRLAIYIRKLEEEYAKPGLGWEQRGSDKDILKGRDTFKSSKRMIRTFQLLTLLFGVLYSFPSDKLGYRLVEFTSNLLENLQP